jgi:hypothetical protein
MYSSNSVAFKALGPWASVCGLNSERALRAGGSVSLSDKTEQTCDRSALGNGGHRVDATLPDSELNKIPLIKHLLNKNKHCGSALRKEQRKHEKPQLSFKLKI